VYNLDQSEHSSCFKYLGVALGHSGVSLKMDQIGKLMIIKNCKLNA
jgi:hypothetical protein